MTKQLFTFNFIGGGFNQVYANNEGEAKMKAQAEFGQYGIDQKSFRPVKDEDAYYASFPLMD